MTKVKELEDLIISSCNLHNTDETRKKVQEYINLSLTAAEDIIFLHYQNYLKSKTSVDTVDGKYLDYPKDCYDTKVLKIIGEGQEAIKFEHLDGKIHLPQEVNPPLEITYIRKAKRIEIKNAPEYLDFSDDINFLMDSEDKPETLDLPIALEFIKIHTQFLVYVNNYDMFKVDRYGPLVQRAEEMLVSKLFDLAPPKQHKETTATEYYERFL